MYYEAMPAKLDLLGLRFGMLTVTGDSGTMRGRPHWACRCDCGGVSTVSSANLRKGTTKSCGCQKRKGNRRSHGMSKTYEYDVWTKMVSRCENVSDKSYHRYGGRGIGVCERWKSFENFIADMGRRPDGARWSIDRIDNDSGYCPDNCRWATDSEQARNRRSSHKVMFRGELRTIAEIADESCVSQQLLRSRIVVHGWDVESAVTTPPGEAYVPKPITIGGQTKLIKEWLNVFGISRGTYCSRVRSGMSPDEALSSGPKRKRRSVSTAA